MSQTALLLSGLRRRGFRLTPAPGGVLNVEPGSKLTPADVALVTRFKADLLTLLAVEQPEGVQGEVIDGAVIYYRTPAERLEAIADAKLNLWPNVKETKP